MDDFLQKFFPAVLANKRKVGASKNAYCKYNNQKLQAFTSSLYIAGLVSTLFASLVTRRYGRRPTMLIAGLCFVLGVLFNTSAQNLLMLILGRVLLGWGVGFANQASCWIIEFFCRRHALLISIQSRKKSGFSFPILDLISNLLMNPQHI
jgi:MFS family permease